MLVTVSTCSKQLLGHLDLNAGLLLYFTYTLVRSCDINSFHKCITQNGIRYYCQLYKSLRSVLCILENEGVIAKEVNLLKLNMEVCSEVCDGFFYYLVGLSIIGNLF